MFKIDLNCDLGEGAKHDADIIPLITSANIGCSSGICRQRKFRKNSD